MRSLIAALVLVLGLSSAYAGKATTTTTPWPAGGAQVVKTWTLKNGTKVTHLSNRSEDGKVTSWRRTTESKTGRQTIRGVTFDKQKYTGHVGALGNSTISQMVYGSGEKQTRTVQIDNGTGRSRYQLHEDAKGAEIIKSDKRGLTLVK